MYIEKISPLGEGRYLFAGTDQDEPIEVEIEIETSGILTLNAMRKINIRKLSRTGENSYTLHGDSDCGLDSVQFRLNDLDLVEFAALLGFGDFYPDLDTTLDGVEGWTGDILLWGGIPDQS